MSSLLVMLLKNLLSFHEPVHRGCIKLAQLAAIFIKKDMRNAESTIQRG